MGDRLTIAIHDNGIDLLHPELAKHLLEGRVFDNRSNRPWPVNQGTKTSHGTLCACFVKRVAIDCQLLPVRYSGRDVVKLVESLAWAATKAKVVLCPWILEDGSARRIVESFLDSLGSGARSALFVFSSANEAGSNNGIFSLNSISVKLDTADGNADSNADLCVPHLLPIPEFPTFERSLRTAPMVPKQRFNGNSAAAAFVAGLGGRFIADEPSLSVMQLREKLLSLDDREMRRHWNAALEIDTTTEIRN